MTTTAIWKALRAALGSNPPERAKQLAADALLVRILIDRQLIDEFDAGSAAADRDRSGLLIEHVLHTRYGMPLEALLDALAERRAIMTSDAPARMPPRQLTA